MRDLYTAKSENEIALLSEFVSRLQGDNSVTTIGKARFKMQIVCSIFRNCRAV